MEDTTIIYKVPGKRRIWVSVVLWIFGPGLPMIYCGRLWQGIIVEAIWAAIYFLLYLLLALIPEFYMFLVMVFIAISLGVGFLVYNIMLTIKTNRRKIPRLKRTWSLIILVLVISWFGSSGISFIKDKYLVEAYSMPASSMEDALLVGDHLFATKNIDPDEIQNGDLIVFKYPGDPRNGYSDKGANYIKRLIAMGGQTVEIINKKVLVDGKPFREPPTVKFEDIRVMPFYEDEYEWGFGNRDNMPEITVPPKKIFVMGDNRDNSSDSRYWGFVDVDDVIGKARFIHFSWDSEDNRIRWERLGMRLDRYPER
jgi:signal peptidase I